MIGIRFRACSTNAVVGGETLAVHATCKAPLALARQGLLPRVEILGLHWSRLHRSYAVSGWQRFQPKVERPLMSTEEEIYVVEEIIARLHPPWTDGVAFQD